MPPMVRAATLTNFVDVARQVGLDPARALRQAGLDPRVLADPERRLPAATVNDLFERAAAESGCQTFGLRMGELRRLSDFGAISLLINHQPTPRAALATLIAFRRMLNEALILDVEESNDLVIVRELLMLGDSGPAVQAHELMVAVLYRMFRGILGPRWRPLSINFTHAAPADRNVHRRVFGVDVEFGSEFNGLVLAAADLDRPNPTADPALAQYARQFVETLPNAGQDDAVQQARKAVYHLLPLGRATLADVAQTLGFNPRTLQRRLGGLGAEFSNIVASVRRDLAVRYLANSDLSVTQVAELLGYARIGSFTRWFAAEFGVAPTTWMRREADTS